MVLEKLRCLYGDRAEETHQAIYELMDAYRPAIEKHRREQELFTEEDCILITYGDFIRGAVADADPPGQGAEQQKILNPLQTLRQFAQGHLGDAFNAIHILPFYPYYSDRGFSITNFFEVNPSFGTWSDVEQISQDFRLMFDFVLNHMSCMSDWFKKYDSGDPEFADFFMGFAGEYPADRYPEITRPRPDNPVLDRQELKTDFDIELPEGVDWVWRTFLNDQVDLNYKNPLRW